MARRRAGGLDARRRPLYAPFVTPSRVLLPLLTLAVWSACGNADGDGRGAPSAAGRGPAPAADTTAASSDTTAGPVTLPPDFPSDFPLPPDHVVVEASVQPDEAGTFANARLAIVSGGVAELFAWYRQALVDAGWQVAAEGQSAGSRTLHATQGESYIDLTVRPDPERAGRILVEASIWKVEAL